MRAARLYGYKEDFVVEEVATPEPGPGEVLVRIGGAGLCHSDLHIWSGEMAGLGIELPLVLGHENAGWVEALGPGAHGYEAGEPVVVMGGWGCGQCSVCLGGEEQLCDVMRWGGIGQAGGYAEYLVVPSPRHLVRLGDFEPAAAAPLADAALTPYRAVKRALPRLVPGTTVLTIGVGGLGQCGLQFLKALSPAKVVAVDTSPTKQDIAEELGADVVIDPLWPDATERIAAALGPDGAAAVFDYVGSDSTLALAARTVGRKGLLTVVGLAGGSLPYTFLGLATEATVTSSMWGTRNELAEVVALARKGAVGIVAEQVPLDDVNEAFGRLRRGEVGGRLVLVP